jgi:VanZ family protein
MAIIWLSLSAAPPTPNMPLLGWDKFLHAAAYGTLTMLAGWAFSAVAALSGRSWLLIAVCSVVISGMMEIAQAAFTATRKAEWGDLIANCVGVAAVLLVARIARTFEKSRQDRTGTTGNE